MSGIFSNKRALLLSYDDTSIYHAKIMEKQFSLLNISCDHALVTKRKKNHVNQRQINLHNINFKFTIARHHLASPKISNEYDIYFSAVPIVPLRNFERFYNHCKNKKRPLIIYSFRGIEEPVHIGLMNRLGADLIILNNIDHLNRLKRYLPIQDIIKEQNFSIGSPIFWEQISKNNISQPPINIYFYTQSIIPKSKDERLRVAQNLILYAQKYSERNLWVKLRHLPNENKNHSHREEYDFPSLFNELCPNGLPNNLQYTAEDMKSSIEKADLCLTVRSTAIFEALSHNIPSALLPESEDFLYKTFKSSGLVLTYEDFLNDRIPVANACWVIRNIPKPYTALQSFTSQLEAQLIRRDQSTDYLLSNKQLIRRGFPHEKIQYKKLKKELESFIKQQDEKR